MALRWGIVSAGKISHDFVNALNKLPSSEHAVVAVAARDLERSKEFAKVHNIPNAYGSYDELAKCSNIDVIYVGALNPHHFEIGMLMLEHGKNVLVEKPLGMNEKQARLLIAYAKEKNLFLMEGIWSRFFPAVQYVSRQIANGALGTVQEIDVTFGVPQLHAERSMKKELGGGTILGLGVYVIQLAQLVFQESPIAITATGELNADGVDIAVVGELQYSSVGIVKFQTTAKGWLENSAIIKGSKGQLTLPHFWCPTSLIDVDNKQKEWKFPFGEYKTNFPNSEGLVYEAQEVRKCILEGKSESEYMSHDESILIAHIEDLIRNQVGVVYAEDLN